MPRAYFNPFYLLSVIIGIAFLITAVAYGVMAFRGATPHLLEGAEDQSSIMIFLSKHGVILFLIELGALMLTTIAAIATDDFWSRRGGADPTAPEENGQPSDAENTVSNETTATADDDDSSVSVTSSSD